MHERCAQNSTVEAALLFLLLEPDSASYGLTRKKSNSVLEAHLNAEQLLSEVVVMK